MWIYWEYAEICKMSETVNYILWNFKQITMSVLKHINRQLVKPVGIGLKYDSMHIKIPEWSLLIFGLKPLQVF